MSTESEVYLDIPYCIFINPINLLGLRLWVVQALRGQF